VSALAAFWSVHLAHALWQSTIAAAIALLLIRALPNASPRYRHAIASLALLKFVLPPMLPLPTGLFSAAPPVPELRVVRDAIAGTDPRLLVALMLIHAAGIAVALARLAAGMLRLRGIVARAERTGPFLVSGEICVPMTTGSVVLIPRNLHETLSSTELGDVLAHEREHIRRRDVTTGKLHALVAALWWFHPLAHLLVREGRLLREECCDDAVLSGGLDAAGYARTLLRAAAFATGRAPAPAAAIAESPHTLLRRIRRMAAERFAPSPRLSRRAVAGLILLALLLLPGLRVSRGNRVAFDHATRHAIHH
jgi:hypothetical protein